jgi:hypothetical protein
MRQHSRFALGAMATWSRVIGASMTLVLGVASAADARSIYVDKDSPIVYEDGSASAPFRTITRALEFARKLRFGSPDERIVASTTTIDLQVAPSLTPYVGSFDPAVFDPASRSYDPSKEKLPLLLNIPRLNVHGGTRLVVGDDGLPSLGMGRYHTIVRADRPQGPKQFIVMVTRTLPVTDRRVFPPPPEMAGDDVTITGFWFQAEDGRQIPSALIGIDGVNNFEIRDNVMAGGGSPPAPATGGFGVWTRLSSGRIEGNLVVNNTVGFYVTGGSRLFPATVEIRSNRVNSSVALGGTAGLLLVGSAETEDSAPGVGRRDLDFGPNGSAFYRVPLPAFDRLLKPNEVPDHLYAEVAENEFIGHAFGIRTTGYLAYPYILPDGQDETANVRARFSRNVSRSNTLYGLIVDAGQIRLGDRRIVAMDLAFVDTTLEENGRGPALFSFWRFAGSIGPNPFSMPNPTFAHDSTIRACGDVTRFHYDNRQDPHRPTNPAPTNNQLFVNNVALTGLQVDSLVEVPPLECAAIGR